MANNHLDHYHKRPKVEEISPTQPHAPLPGSAHYFGPGVVTRLPSISHLSSYHKSPLLHQSNKLSPVNSSYSTSAPSLYQLAPINTAISPISAVGTSSLDALASVASSASFELATAAADEPTVEHRSQENHNKNYWPTTNHSTSQPSHSHSRTFDLVSNQLGRLDCYKLIGQRGPTRPRRSSKKLISINQSIHQF